MLDLIYSEKGPYSQYRKQFLENKTKKKIRNEIVNRKVNQLSLSLNKSSHILDFGCGDGVLSLKLCKKKVLKI